jgi:hypothetical protein
MITYTGFPAILVPCPVRTVAVSDPVTAERAVGPAMSSFISYGAEMIAAGQPFSLAATVEVTARDATVPATDNAERVSRMPRLHDLVEKQSRLSCRRSSAP